MKDIQTYEIAAEEGAFISFPRNIRVQLDGTAATVDLIPSIVLDEPTAIVDRDISPKINEILGSAKPIVEANRLMRVHLDFIHAFVIQEEFIQLVDIPEGDIKNIPRIDDGATYPFLRVANSEWKRGLEDYQGRDDPQLHHFKFLSMETHIDVLSQIWGIEWLENG